MKLPFFKPRQDRVRFSPAELPETTEALRNPARGWYQIHTFPVDREPDLEELGWCLEPQDALALVLFDIGSYRERDLDAAALGRVTRVLDYFAERHYDCVVRAVYDRQGRAPEREPFFFAQVLAHLEQLAGALRPCPAVFVYQGMLVGSWGEMHSSRFLSREQLRQMAEVLRARRGEGTWLAVRRPSQWRRLHGEKEGTACTDNMGLFDDGMFGSPDHLGTYGTKRREETSWDSPWRREDELDFLNALSLQAPYGGEAVWGEDCRLGPEEVLEVLRKTGVTYLNRTHDQRLLDLWRRQRCPLRGVWGEKSLFDYVGAHLGYRLVVRGASVAEDRREGCCRVEVEIENTGFAGLYQPAWVGLEYPDGEGRPRLEKLEGQGPGWPGGETRRLCWTIAPGDGELLLLAGRSRDDARISFANPSDGQGRVLLGCLSRE